MNNLRVEIPATQMWFVLGALLGILTVITTIFSQGSYAWVGTAILGVLAAAPIAWGLFGAKRFIEFGDSITIHYLLKQRRIPWSKVSFVSFECTEVRHRTGIPFVHIPTQNHVMTIRLRDDSTVCADIKPAQIAPIQEIFNQRATFDVQREKERVVAELVSEQRFALLLRAAMGFMFSVIGIYIAYLMLDEIKDGTASVNWPEVPGSIVNSSYTSETTSGRRGRKDTIYTPAVQYTFEVEGVEYSSKRLQFSPITSEDPQEIQSLVNQLPMGSIVKVRYKPTDPSVAVLIPGIGTGRYIFFGVLIVVGIGALIFAIVNVFRYLHSRSPQTVT